MKIGIAFDLAPTDPAIRSEGPDDQFEEFDKPETVEAIAEVIRGEGHEVVLLGDGREFLTRVLADPPDFVFNIAEGEGVGRCREARVPAVLEMLGIPYSGSDPLTLAASLDKDVAKRMLEPMGQPTVYHREFRTPESCVLSHDPSIGSIELEQLYDDREGMPRFGPFHEPSPLIFKPTFEGSSKGIRGACVAESFDEALAIYLRLARDYAQPILAEEFIEGDEITVGLMGNENKQLRSHVEVLGVMRIVPKRPEGQFVYSLEVKRDWRNRVDYEAPAFLDGQLLQTISLYSRIVFERLGCRDLVRIDFRVRDRVLYFIEANPLPGLAPGTSDLVILAEGHGIGYGDLIRRILHASLTRVGLK